MREEEKWEKKNGKGSKRCPGAVARAKLGEEKGMKPRGWIGLGSRVGYANQDDSESQGPL